MIGPIAAGIVGEDRLENGLRVLCHSVPGSPIASVNLLTQVGSSDEPIGRRGYAHLIEHLTFHGSERLPRGEYDRICTMAGGESNAWTSTDLTGYWIALPNESLEVALALEAARAAGPELDEEGLENERRIVEAERRQVIENVPYGEAGRIVREMLYGDDHPYRHEPIGSGEDLAAATTASISTFFHDHYGADRSLLVVAADRPVPELRTLAEDHFGSLPPAGRERRRIVPNGTEIRREIVSDRSPLHPLPAVQLSWHAPATTDERTWALDLLAMILADGDGSRLPVALEYRSMLAAETGAWLDDGELGSSFNLWSVARDVQTDPEQLLSAMVAELRRIADEGISDQEMMTVRNRKLATVISSLGSISTTAERLAVYTALYDDPSLVWNEPAAYESVSRDAIVAEAETLLAADHVTATFSPAGD